MLRGDDDAIAVAGFSGEVDGVLGEIHGEVSFCNAPVPAAPAE